MGEKKVKKGKSNNLNQFVYFMLLVIVFATFGAATPKQVYAAEQLPQVRYRAQIDTIGWQAYHTRGTAGTTGKHLGMKGIQVKIQNVKNLGVRYRAYIKGEGWTSYVTDGKKTGTSKKGKTIQAVQMSLTGKQAKEYDIYYRVYVDQIGWLDWAKNNQKAGSTNLDYHADAVEISICKKGEKAPGATNRAVLGIPKLQYRVKLQTGGWQKDIQSPKTAGTINQKLCIKALKIQTGDTAETVGVTYRVCQKGKWSDYSEDGEQAGDGKTAIEAIQVNLTGKDAKYFDVYYRTNTDGIGWLDWAKNGTTSGTGKISKRIQALEIVIRTKTADAPGKTKNPYCDHVDTEAEALARKKLNEIGWSLEAAFKWSSSMAYTTRDTWVKPGYTNADWYAIFGFTTGGGNCYNMAATFYQMAKLLGYEVYYVQGYLPQRNGSKVTHGWVELIKDGKLYVCDPNFTWNHRGNGLLIQYGQKGTWRYVDYKRLQ